MSLQNWSCLVYPKCTLKFQTELYETYLTNLDCDSVIGCRPFGGTSRRWKQHLPLLPPELYGVTTQNASTVKTEAECPFEAFMSYHRTARCQPRKLNPEDGGRMSSWSVYMCPQNYMVSIQEAWTLKMEAECLYPPTLRGVTIQKASTLKMEAQCLFETTISTHRPTRCHNPEHFKSEDGGRMSLWNNDIHP
jgi:hypothetical protein